MEVPNKTNYDYEYFMTRLNKIEDSLNKVGTTFRVLTLEMKKTQNSPFMRVVNAICKIIDFVLKPIIWLISFCLNKKNIKPVGPDRTDSSALSAACNT